MKNSPLIALVAAIAFALGTPAWAAPKEKEPTAEKPSAGKKEQRRAIPFHGKVIAVDSSAKTFSLHGKVKERVFTVTDQTSFKKDDAAADLGAMTVGDEVRGQAYKAGENWEAIKVLIGPKEIVKTSKGDNKPPGEENVRPVGNTPAAPPAAQ